MWAELPELLSLWQLAAAAVLLGLLCLLLLLIVLVLFLRQRRQWLALRGELESRLSQLAVADERLERVLREEGVRGRDEANAAGKALREEVGGLLRGFQDSVLRTMAEMQTLQKAQLQLFAERLDDGVRRIDQRVEGMAAALKEGMSETRAGLDLRHKDLRQSVETQLTELKGQAAQSDRALREEVQGSLKSLGDGLIASLGRLGESQRERLTQLAEELARLTRRQEQAQEALRLTVEGRLDSLRADNAEKLETIRKTVDEQLQGTLEKRLGESFRLVSERLELVHKGLGEMQSLASGVGDLKRVLSNVKTRGTWGEVQLGSILEQLLTPEQYLTNTPTRPGSAERVEYAIRLPGKGEGEPEVLLPIDAKFPLEDYGRLTAAAELGDGAAVEEAARQLENRIRACARDIRDKYLHPPHTTDFAILFLPTEGLYAEILRRPGLAEQLQRDCRVTLAGPTTLAATLNALQMGFRTLAIQKRSGEVWRVLEAVKTEFGRYGEVLDKVQKKLHEATRSIDGVAVRRRAIDRTLRAVGRLPEEEARVLLGLDDPRESEE